MIQNQNSALEIESNGNNTLTTHASSDYNISSICVLTNELQQRSLCEYSLSFVNIIDHKNGVF